MLLYKGLDESTINEHGSIVGHRHHTPHQESTLCVSVCVRVVDMCTYARSVVCVYMPVSMYVFGDIVFSVHVCVSEHMCTCVC